MKIAGIGRSHRPNMVCLGTMQKHSTRGWNYRLEEGWVFDELAPDELTEFKSYGPGITIPGMRVRLPYSQAIWFKHEPNFLVNWFAYCTMPQAPSLALSRFQIHQITNAEQISYFRYPVNAGSYGAWLWYDEVKVCRELGCKVTVHHGWGWVEWGVPIEWKPPLHYQERIFIYAFVNELAQEAYIGQTDSLERRWIEHLRDTKNSGKVALIQSIRAQGHEPKLIQLEEVPGERAIERERYWTSYYKGQGYKIINQDYKSLI